MKMENEKRKKSMLKQNKRKAAIPSSQSNCKMFLTDYDLERFFCYNNKFYQEHRKYAAHASFILLHDNLLQIFIDFLNVFVEMEN